MFLVTAYVLYIFNEKAFSLVVSTVLPRMAVFLYAILNCGTLPSNRAYFCAFLSLIHSPASHAFIVISSAVTQTFSQYQEKQASGCNSAQLVIASSNPSGKENKQRSAVFQ